MLRQAAMQRIAEAEASIDSVNADQSFQAPEAENISFPPKDATGNTVVGIDRMKRKIEVDTGSTSLTIAERPSKKAKPFSMFKANPTHHQEKNRSSAPIPLKGIRSGSN
jgi:hypothetical protein